MLPKPDLTCPTEQACADVLRYWRLAKGQTPCTIADFCTFAAGDPEHPSLTDYGKRQTEREWLVFYQLCFQLADMGLLRPEGGTENHVQMFVARLPWMEHAK